MLDLVQVFSGRPTSDLSYLFLPKETLVIYSSVDSVVILNIQRLTFLRSLVFWEVFPALYESGGTISCVCVDTGHNLIIASVGARIGAWCLSKFKEHIWRVHSSIVLDERNDITCLDCRSGLLAVGTMHGLTVFTLSMINDIPSWSKKWTLRLPGCFSVKFSPSLTHLAISSIHDFSVRILSTAAGMQTQIIRHSRPVKKIAWRCSQKSNRTDFILYSVTSDATLRIFIPVLDAPQHLLLHASLDLFSIHGIDSMSDLTSDDKSAGISNIFWLDGDVLSPSQLHTLSQAKNSAEPDTLLESYIKQQKGEDLEYFVRLFKDGSIVLTALSDIDRKPPTLIRQLKMSESSLEAFDKLPSHFQVLSSIENSTVMLIASPPILTYCLDSLLFFRGHEKKLHFRARSTYINTTDYQTNIQRFVRSPEGSGVGIIRASSSETWSISTDAGQEQMQQMGNWATVDHIVILDGGKRTALYSSHNQMLVVHPSSPFVSLELPLISSLFCLPSSDSLTSIFGLTSDFTIIHIILRTTQDRSELYVHSRSALPLAELSRMIIPVDPMAWSDRPHHVERVHDVLLSIACDGELAFWIPGSLQSEPWICTAKVRTARTAISIAKCSSSKKSALINSSNIGEELTIWDSKESEFASGLEYRHVFDRSEVINDLDWTSTPDEQSILAVGFSHHVLILCQQRMTYFNEEPAWGLCRRIDMSDFTSHPISDSIWLTGGSLLVAAGHQMFRFNTARSSSKVSERRSGLFEHVARLNGPLQEYHPQMILQCLLWGKLKLVEKIIIRLYENLLRMEHDATYTYDQWEQEPIDSFISSKIEDKIVSSTGSISNSTKEAFSRQLINLLLGKLTGSTVLSHLSRNEVAHLVVLIHTTMEIEEQSRSLDHNGLRYLISMRSFYILNNGNLSREKPSNSEDIDKQARVRDRLRFRDMVWAFHSESQEILLSASIAACGGKMLWQDAKALGIFLWTRSFESIIQFEMIARNLYTENDGRDPLACCLYYFALGKIKLVHGLWKQAAGHKEQGLMLKFLSNDFSQSRWQTAALKNAYALISKQRFELAAAFFLLGGSLKDAVNVCIKNLDDFQLAIALARIVEHDDNGPILKTILLDTVLPMAFRKGNRWLGSWSFWLLHRRDLAVKILVTPLENIVNTLNMAITDIGDPHYDDPSLALLFSQIKARTLQTAKGTSEIDGRTEFNFVLQIARVFCRMGCHVLALDLVKTWSFGRTNIYNAVDFSDSPISAPSYRRSSRRGMRRSSIAIDMDLSTSNTIDPMPSISQSFEDTYPKSHVNENMEDLMKHARKDINIPEFDINAFM